MECLELFLNKEEATLPYIYFVFECVKQANICRFCNSDPPRFGSELIFMRTGEHLKAHDGKKLYQLIFNYRNLTSYKF